jgi:type 1 fimbria pilin
MKKLSIVTMMLMMTFSATYAAGLVKPEFNKVKNEISKVKQVNVHHEIKTDAECSITLKGKVDLGPVEAEVSCTTTAATCNEATIQAVSCLRAAMKTVRTIIY